MDIYGPGVMHTPVMADLIVKEEKVEATTESGGKTMDELKQEALQSAITKSNADVLVEPRYSTETKNGRTSVTVKGFPANYKNFRSATPSDTALLKIGFLQKAENASPNPIRKKSSAGLVITMVALAIGLLIATSSIE